MVLVEPKIEGNVGAVARSMANFGLRDLVLVNAPVIGDEAFRRAKHGRPILEAAKRVRDLESALREADLVVGTTGVSTRSERRFHRQAVPPWEAADRLTGLAGQVSLVLGREDYGLSNEQLDRMDLLVNIPCAPSYPVMNVSHAATVLFYELSKVSHSHDGMRGSLAEGSEKERLLEAFHELLVTTLYPAHRRRRTEVMFRRIMSRALPTKWEFHALMGVFRGASKTVRRLSESPGPGPSS